MENSNKLIRRLGAGLFLTVLFAGCQLSGHEGKKEWVIPANKSYVVPFQERESGIRHRDCGSNNAKQEDITGWSDSGKSVEYFLYFNPGDYDLELEARLKKGNISSFEAHVNAVDPIDFPGVVSSFKVKGNGSFGHTSVTHFTIEKEGFYRLALKPVKKDGQYFGDIRNLKFFSKNENGKVRYANWLSSPSVHLSFSSSDDQKRDFDWLYGEVMVPEGADPLYTFYMCLGFFRGYLGIQVNHEDERRVLFSVWDSSEEGIDRANVEGKDRVTLLGKGEGVKAGGFGNEGTGGQSYRIYPWKSGTPIQFLMNVKKLPDNYLVFSAWFRDGNSEEWNYMASWRAPRDTRYFNGFYSFLENFGTGTGQEMRKAYYYNMWGKDVSTNQWIQFDKARMTYTDGEENSRSDFAGGIVPGEDGKFFMSSGGYFSPLYKEYSVIRKSENFDIDLSALERQVKHSIESGVVALDYE